MEKIGLGAIVIDSGAITIISGAINPHSGAIIFHSGAIHKKGSKSSMDLLPFLDKGCFRKVCC